MWLKKRGVLTPNVFGLVTIVIAQVLVLLIIHAGRTTSLENACSSHTICSSPAAGARALSLGKGSGAVTAVAGYEVGGSVVLSSRMKGLSKLIDSLTPLQGLQARVRACPTGEVINLFDEGPTGRYPSDLCSSNLLIMNSQPHDAELVEHSCLPELRSLTTITNS